MATPFLVYTLSPQVQEATWILVGTEQSYTARLRPQNLGLTTSTL